MNRRIFLTLILILGLSLSVDAQSKKSVRIVDVNVVRVEKDNKDFNLVFEIDVAFRGLLGSEIGFCIAPLQDNDELIFDSEGLPLLAGEIYEIEKNSGEGTVEISVPLSYFPQTSDHHHYECSILDTEYGEALAESGPRKFSTMDIKKLLSQKAFDQVLNIFDFFLGGGGSGSGKDNDDGSKTCSYCGGTGKCATCDGSGKYWNEVCLYCSGNGRCVHCDGKGGKYSFF